MARVTASYLLNPMCPRCERLLDRPAHWRDFDGDDKHRIHEVFCEQCKVFVRARFMTAMDWESE
jgi:hypothetical protein